MTLRHSLFAVGSEQFVEQARSEMGVMAVGRNSTKAEESYQLREPSILYGDHFEGKKCDRGPENTVFKDINPKISISWRGPTPIGHRTHRDYALQIKNPSSISMQNGFHLFPRESVFFRGFFR
jgi:hypothetical protein